MSAIVMPLIRLKFAGQHVVGLAAVPHWMPAPANVPAHANCVEIEHVVPLQHAPEGCGHVFGEHTPSCAQAPAHSLCSEIVHAPDAAQHLPGHGLGAHRPSIVHTPVQSPWSVLVQLGPMQQEPNGGPHGCVAHEPPIAQVPEQEIWILMEHTRPTQHEPGGTLIDPDVPE
jgi:hypothetical protein